MKNSVHSALLALAVSATASAEMLNISASGLHSATVEQIACTIVSNDDSVTVNGYRMLAVFAESGAGGSNARVLARSLQHPYEISNNDWRGVITINGDPVGNIDNEPLFSKTLRLPSRISDAAFAFMALPGEPLCAFSTEEGNPAGFFAVNLSITDITEAYLQHFNPDGTPK